MRMRQVVVVPAALLALAVSGCGEDGSSGDREERSADAVNECRGHGGVSAFDDDVVICVDQTSESERGTRDARWESWQRVYRRGPSPRAMLAAARKLEQELTGGPSTRAGLLDGKDA